MNLLRIGGIKQLDSDRWRDILDCFDHIYCICILEDNVIESIDDEGKKKITFINASNSIIVKALIRLGRKISFYKGLAFINDIIIVFLRLLNRRMLKSINSLSYDYIISGFGDYDLSDLLTLIVKPVLNKRILRSYKESRPNYNYHEKKCFCESDVISLTNKHARKFFEYKYGRKIFDGKKILYGGDENFLSSRLVSKIKYEDKISQNDGRIHAVILAGKVFSEDDDVRSGARLYYIDLIKKLNEIGIVVHLHTMRIFKDKRGIDQYSILEKESKGMFFVEKPLDFNSKCIESCQFISKYDIGVLHNFREGASVSLFDRTNIPHRLYEYEAAHVYPIIKQGDNEIIEEIFRSKSCGIIYTDLKDIMDFDFNSGKYYVPTYKQFVEDTIINERNQYEN